MGRPLNKKYFGNRNIGSTTVTTDDGIGGEGVASVVLDSLGNYTTRPTFTFSAPQLPGGVTATGTISSEASTVAPDGTLLDGTGYAVDDLITFAGITGVVGRVAVVGSGQQEIQSIDFVGAGTARGDFEAISALTKTGLAVTIIGKVGGGTPSSGTGQTVAITFRAKAVVITKAGSGYTSAPTSTPTQSVTFDSVVLTTDSGSAGSSTNQENAIVVTAFIPAANGGTTAATGDIVKQTNDRRYKVKTSEGTGICQLVTDGVANAAGEVSIKATDSEGGNYLVAKLTSRKVVLVPAALGGSAGTQFASGASAKWSFTTTIEDAQVVIENA